MTIRQLDATNNGRGLHCLVLMPLLPLRLTTATRSATGTSECTRGTAATASATTARTTTMSATGSMSATASAATEVVRGLGGHLTGARVGWHHRRCWSVSTALLRGSLIAVTTATATARLRVSTGTRRVLTATTLAGLT